MKHIIALCLMLFALPAFAAPAEMNLYIMLWPEGVEDDPTKAQVMEMGEGDMRIFTSATPEHQDDVIPLDPAHVALMGAAIKSVLADLSLEYGEDYKGDQIQVEWSISNNNGFSRGSTLFPIDAVPAAVIAVQDQVFGMRLTP